MNEPTTTRITFFATDAETGGRTVCDIFEVSMPVAQAQRWFPDCWIPPEATGYSMTPVYDNGLAPFWRTATISAL